MSHASSRRELGRDFARRIYGPRTLGCACSLIFISAVALEHPTTSLWVWGLMLFNAFVWPTLAYLTARASLDPFAVERRSLLCDALFSGLWVGQMALNPLPSALLLAMVAMNAMAAGGWKLLRVCLGLQGLGLLATLALGGFELVLHTSETQLWACLPMLLLYPLSVSQASYGLAVQLAIHKKAFKIISTLDGMTSLLHHAAWMERLRTTFGRCKDGQGVAILALLDIDDFKKVNDGYGHLVGDAIIARLANLLRAGLGVHAVPGRYGGDEFCVLLFDMTVSQAYDQLNDIRELFCEWADDTSPVPKVSLSIGLVPYSRKYSCERVWLQAADEALYRAKHSGKNRLWLQELPIG